MSGYGQWDGMTWLGDGNPETTARVLEVGAGDLNTWNVMNFCRLTFFGYFVTVAFNYDTLTALGIIALDKIALGGTTRTELARVSLVSGQAANTIVGIKADAAAIVSGVVSTTKLAAMDLNPGDRLVLEVVTAATGGGSIAGDWRPIITVEPRGAYEKPLIDAGYLTLSSLAQV